MRELIAALTRVVRAQTGRDTVREQQGRGRYYTPNEDRELARASHDFELAFNRAVDARLTEVQTAPDDSDVGRALARLNGV